MDNQFVLKAIIELMNDNKAKHKEKGVNDYFDIPLDGDDETVKKKYITGTDNGTTKLELNTDGKNENGVETRPMGQKNMNNVTSQFNNVIKAITKLGSRKQSKSYANKSFRNNKDNTTCKECGRFYSTYESLRFHIKAIHLKQKRIKCEDCGYETNKRSNFERHTKRYHTDKFVSHKKRKYTSVKLIKKEETDPKCSLCDETFPNLKLLSNHKNEKHSKKINEESYTKFCDICNKEFSSRQSFKYHTITNHTKVYPEMCDSCGKGFTGTGLGETLQKHIQTCGNFKS